jgi:WD40 repeat protein
MMEINTALAAVDSERKRVEKEYREKMEEGRRHLSEKNWKSAKAAFAAALRLRPGDREAGEGQEEARLAIHRNVEAMERLHVLRDHSGRVAALAYGGRTAISGGEDNHLRFWLDGRLVRKAAGHSSAVWSIAVSGARVATAGGDGRILVRDLDGAELHALSGPASGTMAVAFTRDGKRLVSGGNENPAVVWDLTTREPVRVLDRASVGAQSVALSANDRMLATSGFGAEVRLWDLESGRPLGELSGHASGPLALAFAPEGALLVSGGPDGRIGFWDASARRELRAPVDAEAPVLAVAFRPDGPFVAAAVGKSVRIYAPSSGALVRTLEGHGDAVRALAWSADGTELASGDEAGVIHVWGVKE